MIDFMTPTANEFVDEEIFYESVRQYVISLLTFICIYFSSYIIICQYKRRTLEDSDLEDDLVYRVSVWLCCFTMTVSIGAVLLLPFSIFSNEILISCPDCYYVKWLNDSLIQGLWNQIFLGTYIAMFLAMPFAYFFTESEGFAGSGKGIKARIYETFVVLILLLVLASTLVWVFSAFVAKKELNLVANNSDSWMPPLPFIYSCISLFGALVLLICTPLGFTRLFDVLGTYVVRPQFFVDLDDQIEAKRLEENDLSNKLMRASNRCSGMYFEKQLSTTERETKLADVIAQRLKLERERDASGFEKNLLYPLCLIGLLAITAICLLMVALNCFKLLFGGEAYPLMRKYPSLGQISISKLGWFGIFLQIFLIFYIMSASIVGFYSSPLFRHLRPKKSDTSMVTMIINSVILLILSSALPVLVTTLGITSFNLMGEFGRLDWLGNFELVLFYNLFFEASTSFCLVRKFTKTVRDAIYASIRQSNVFSSWRKSKIKYK